MVNFHPVRASRQEVDGLREGAVGFLDAGAQVQTAILKHREESGEGTSGCQGPPATELGSHMCFITNPLAILQGKNYYLPWRN